MTMKTRLGSPIAMFIFLAGGLVTASLFAACGGNGGTGGNGDGGGGDVINGGDGNNNGDGNSDAFNGLQDANDFPCDGCSVFPPLNAPQCDPKVLGPSTLVYPLDGFLLPPNMNVLEVQWVPPQGAMLFEVDFENKVTDVRVETTCNQITTVRGAANVGCGLTLAQQEWDDIANANRDGDPLKVTVRATAMNLNCVSTSPQDVNLSFAKDDLTGGIYYWQSATYGGVAGHTGGIYYHDFGTFDPTPTPFYTSGSLGTCVGCHTLSKDGVRISLETDDPDADDEFGDVHTHVMDVATRTVVGGQNVSPGFQTFTHDHALMIASTFKGGMMMMGMGGDKAFAVWDGNGMTTLATDPLPNGMTGTQPNLSWDDKTLVFVAPAAGTISMAGDHHFLGGSLWSAAFDTKAYGLTNFAQLLTPTAQQNFYYPDQSVDGNWLIFNENDDNSAANNTGDSFYSRRARVKVMHFPPQQGDKPLDLQNANVADGLTNSWPRWSPAPTSFHGKKILWITFSSNRDYGLHLKNSTTGYPPGPCNGDGSAMCDNYYPPESPMYDQPQPMSKQNVTFDGYAAPQIWMAGVIIDTDHSLDATDRSYPAFWLPFQDVTAHNHSAQWVAKVQAPPPPGDGGAGDGGNGGDGGPPACNETNGACGPNGGTCCVDVVCCPSNNTCQPTCIF
jgi:hypothetical protein